MFLKTWLIIIMTICLLTPKQGAAMATGDLLNPSTTSGLHALMTVATLVANEDDDQLETDATAIDQQKLEVVPDSLSKANKKKRKIDQAQENSLFENTPPAKRPALGSTAHYKKKSKITIKKSIPFFWADCPIEGCQRRITKKEKAFIASAMREHLMRGHRITPMKVDDYVPFANCRKTKQLPKDAQQVSITHGFPVYYSAQQQFYYVHCPICKRILHATDQTRIIKFWYDHSKTKVHQEALGALEN